MSGNTTTQRVWLVTGTSSGFGRELVLQILARGDKAIATARGRSFSKLADLKEKGASTYELDVNASQDDLNAFAKKVVDEHGHVDVLVNNAGYFELNAQEPSTPEDALSQFSTNVFAPMNINRAFLPYMRARKTGTIVWIGSVAGWTSSAASSLYCATKHAVRALSIGLHAEIAPFGLRSICIEPGMFRTEFLAPGNTRAPDADANTAAAAYDELVQGVKKHYQEVSGKQAGDPVKACKVIIDVVCGEGVAKGKETPLFLPLGSDSYEWIGGVLDRARGVLDEWKEVMCSTDFPR